MATDHTTPTRLKGESRLPKWLSTPGGLAAWEAAAAARAGDDGSLYNAAWQAAYDAAKAAGAVASDRAYLAACAATRASRAAGGWYPGAPPVLARAGYIQPWLEISLFLLACACLLVLAGSARGSELAPGGILLPGMHCAADRAADAGERAGIDVTFHAGRVSLVALAAGRVAK